MTEECLLTGPLEPTNEWYAIAKIAGLKICQAYRRQFGFNAISLMPTNLYGPGDNFDLQNSHVLPALIRRFHEAKIARRRQRDDLGYGRPRREFLHVDDLADAVLHLLENYDAEPIVNIGWGQDVTIAELARLIADAAGFAGRDRVRREQARRHAAQTTRYLAVTALGWRPKIALKEGIERTYRVVSRACSGRALVVN